MGGPPCFAANESAGKAVNKTKSGYCFDGIRTENIYGSLSETIFNYILSVVRV